jgi:hypothetical protein
MLKSSVIKVCERNILRLQYANTSSKSILALVKGRRNILRPYIHNQINFYLHLPKSTSTCPEVRIPILLPNELVT